MTMHKNGWREFRNEIESGLVYGLTNWIAWIASASIGLIRDHWHAHGSLNGTAFFSSLASMIPDLLFVSWWTTVGAVMGMILQTKIQRTCRRRLTVLSSVNAWLTVIFSVLVLLFLKAIGQMTLLTQGAGNSLLFVELAISGLLVHGVSYGLAIRLGFLKRAYPAGCCEHCGYDLRATLGATCPECGQWLTKMQVQ